MDEFLEKARAAKNKKEEQSFVNWGGKGNSFFDKLLRGLYLFLLIAFDFVMFIYSINGKLIENGTINQAIVMILGVFFAVLVILMLILGFSKDIQNGVCAIFTMLITAAFFYQFAQGDVDSFIEHWCDQHASWLSFFCLIPSPWMVGLFLGIIIFFLFRSTLPLLFVTMVLLFTGLVGIQRNEFIKYPNAEYQEIKSFSALSDQDNRDNTIYLFIPQLPSYQFFNGVKEKELRELRDIVIGFLADNGFEIYPNAFVQKNDTMSNIIDILNQVDYTSQLSRNRGFAEFVNNWNFVHGGLDVLSLEKNELNAYLQGNGYKVSMYAMPGFNFCMRGDDFYADRCVVKSDKTVSLYDTRATTEKNVYALLGEWIISLNSRDLKSFAKMFIDMSSLKNYKILAENRRISAEGSTALFDELLDDVKRDPDGHVYLTYVDLPSNVYIYDEYCNLKPRKDWVALKDNSLYPGGIDAKRVAYAEQTKCLFGKLQEFMDALKGSEKLQKTNIIVQGVSTIRELSGMSGDLYSNFVSEGLVTLGIRRAQSPKFLINANICLASDFTKTFINHHDFCYTLDNMSKYNTEDKYLLKKNLINNSIMRNGLLHNSIGNFRDWYKLYKANSLSYQQKQKHIEAEKMRQKNAEAITDEPVRANRLNSSQNDENIFLPTDEPVANEAKEDLLLIAPEGGLADTLRDEEKQKAEEGNQGVKPAEDNSVEPGVTAPLEEKNEEKSLDNAQENKVIEEKQNETEQKSSNQKADTDVDLDLF